MTSLVFCHLMNGVMDRVKVCSFRTLSQVELALGCAVLCSYSHLQVFLGGIGYDLTALQTLQRALPLRKLPSPSKDQSPDSPLCEQLLP